MRVGKNGDIGGIIEVVPNTNSIDGIGKDDGMGLYDYFKTKFGKENSQSF